MSVKKKKRARVLIVDDHPAVREALALRISRRHRAGTIRNTMSAMANRASDGACATDSSTP